MKKKLRSGYTTGACAAAAAKAAALLVTRHPSPVTHVDIPFPDGSRHKFKIQNSKFKIEGDEFIATASVIKNAGDDPDVTNGVEIVAEARIVQQSKSAKVQQPETAEFLHFCTSALVIKGGRGVGLITKPGLPVPVGEHAINPAPRKMIEEAVLEEISNFKFQISNLEITISVPDGEELAKKTLNARLGIIGGISILGTTGIVKPISSEAWTATISSSMDVAKAMGRNEIVLSAGRTSERAHMTEYHLPEESYVLMGDYLEYSLREAKRHGFKKIHLCAQWAKMIKIAMATPQTHVRFGAIDMKKAVEFLNSIGITISQDREFNTAREIFDYINSSLVTRHSSLFSKVCAYAKKYAEEITDGSPVLVHLVSYEGKIISKR